MNVRQFNNDGLNRDSLNNVKDGLNNEDIAHSNWEDLFYPRSIAVIGASDDQRKPGGIVLTNIKAGGFSGVVYPVNPKYQELGGWDCFPGIASVPGPVDLAIISVKSPLVLATLEECAARGIKAAIIFSSGFGEVDEAGSLAQDNIREVASRCGLRLCGPNTMGLVNYLHNMQTNFVYGYNVPAPAGKLDSGLGLIAQSGGMGCSILGACAEKSLDVGIYICTGNEAATDFSDYISYLAQHPGINIIAGYMEGIRDGDKFCRAVELAQGNGKPVVIMKTGGHEASARAARSHTGSLAGSARVYSAIFRQKGVIEVQNIGDMMAVLALLTTGRRPQGNRVAILASSGGHAVVAADKCAAAGLEVVELGQETRAQLAQHLPGYAGTSNPVDFTGIDIVKPGLFRSCSAITASDPSVDALLLMNWLNEEVDSLGQLQKLAQDTDKPLIWAGAAPGNVAAEAICRLIKSGVTFTSDLEAGARALASVASYEANLRQQSSKVLLPGAAPPELLESFRSLKAGTLLGEREVKELLGAYGVRTVPELPAAVEEEAVAAAARLGYPVALKIDSPDIAHKTEISGVMLNLTDGEQVRRAFNAITGEAARLCPGARIRGVLVQKMLQGGLELLVGLSRDPVFGLTLSFGLGGIWVETLGDIALRVLPLTENDIWQMIREIKAYPLLAGARGREPYDLEALVQVIGGVARLGREWPELAELDINPLFLMPRGQGAYAIDAMAAV